MNLNFALAASITGLSMSVPATWTIQTDNGANGTITGVSFANCALKTSSVDITIGGSPADSLADTIESKLNNVAGPTMCDSLNKNLAPKLIGKTVPLL